MQAEHGETGVFAHAAGDARVQQAHHWQARRQASEVQLIDPGGQGEQHLQIRQQRLQIVGRLPRSEVLDVLGIADVRPGAPFDIRGVFGEQRLPLFAAHWVSFIKQGHGHFLKRMRG
ncbi:hypothetical protein D3C87_1809660 [compost metagenome]